MTNDKDKKAKLRAVMTAMKQLEKSHKQAGVVRILGDEDIVINCFPTGSLLFDAALGGKGFPRGRIIELFGSEGSGKTLTSVRAATEVQREGGLVAFIDMEHAFSPDFYRGFGLNIEELIFSQPNDMQQALDVVDKLVDAGVDLIILDSIASLVPREEMEGEVGKQTIGLVARHLGQFLRRISPKLSQNDSTLLCINQTREAIGVMYGDPTTTPGGKALKFYSSVRIQVSKVGGSNVKEKQGTEEVLVGYIIRARVVKNKIAVPFKKAEFMVYLDGRETHPADEIAEVAINRGLILKYDAAGNVSPTGRTFKLKVGDEELIAKKKDDVSIELRKYPKIQDYLMDLIKENVMPDAAIAPHELDSDLDDEEFELKIQEEAKALKNSSASEAEEEETEEDGWDKI